MGFRDAQRSPGSQTFTPINLASETCANQNEEITVMIVKIYIRDARELSLEIVLTLAMNVCTNDTFVCQNNCAKPNAQEHTLE